MNKLIYLCFLLFGIISCRPESIDINVKSAEPKLVAFTHIVPNNIMIVALTKSFSVLDGNTIDDLDSLLVSGATVKILFDNKTFDFIEISPGIYASFNEAYQVDQDYEFIAYKDLDTIRSKTKMLPKVSFESILPEVEKLATDTNVYLNLKFADIPNVSNWYMLNFYRKNTSQDTLYDNVNYFDNGSNNLAKTILLSDKEFGDFYEQKIFMPEMYHKDSIVVTLSNISEAYYKYLNFKVGGGNVLNQLNIEPVNFPTNIQNGYGFFNTHFPDIKFFDLGQY